MGKPSRRKQGEAHDRKIQEAHKGFQRAMAKLSSQRRSEVEVGKTWPRIPPEHSWGVVLTYALSDDEALDFQRRGIEHNVLLGLSNLAMNTPVMCIVCENPHQLVHDKPCTGDPAAARALVNMTLKLQQESRKTL